MEQFITKTIQPRIQVNSNDKLEVVIKTWNDARQHNLYAYLHLFQVNSKHVWTMMETKFPFKKPSKKDTKNKHNDLVQVNSRHTRTLLEAKSLCL